jgi:hypothetical protein
MRGLDSHPHLYPSQTVSQSGNASPSTFLSFRPQGEILDPSHSFGMTTRASNALRHSLSEGEEKESLWKPRYKQSQEI